jgi:fluoroacetyl-CoA thioesterase
VDGIQVGLAATATMTVDDHLLATAMGSGSVAVLATPAMVALMEAAAVNALEPVMSAGQSSVGVALDIRHLAATPPGHQVRARAEVIEVQGKKVTFQVQAWDKSELIGEGTHTRYVIDVARFMQRANAK